MHQKIKSICTFCCLTFFGAMLLYGCQYVSVLDTEEGEQKKEARQVAPVKKETPEVEVASKVSDKLPPLLPPPVKARKKPLSPTLAKYCKKVESKAKRYNWGKLGCADYDWLHVRNSYFGNPIPWVVFGHEDAHMEDDPQNMTLVLCMVHSDEITPLKFCYDIMSYLRKNPDIYKEGGLIAVAPLVNPDGFFRRYPTRTNGRGVDVNRNFPTKDWKAKAIKAWKHRYRSDKRRNPGKRAASEQETIFQMNLIYRYRPDKIITVHAPLTMLDYDGPKIKNYKEEKYRLQGKLAIKLLKEMGEKATSLRVRNFPFFPGSLGNWAGKERKIPTYTLELPSSDERQSKKYWELYKDAIHHAFTNDFRLKTEPGKKTAKANATHKDGDPNHANSKSGDRKVIR